MHTNRHSPQSEGGAFVGLDWDLGRNPAKQALRLIERLLQQATTDDEQTMLRRMLILLLYAHLEGFCKFALLSYASAVNSLGLRCSEAAYPIAAASLSKVFLITHHPQPNP